MSANAVENIRVNVNAHLRQHVDRAEQRVANWLCIEGWLADWPRGEVTV